MSSVFLTSPGNSNSEAANLDDGKANLFINHAKIRALGVNSPVCVDSQKNLVTRKLQAADCDFAIPDTADFVLKSSEIQQTVTGDLKAKNLHTETYDVNGKLAGYDALNAANASGIALAKSLEGKIESFNGFARVPLRLVVGNYAFQYQAVPNAIEISGGGSNEPLLYMDGFPGADRIVRLGARAEYTEDSYTRPLNDKWLTSKKYVDAEVLSVANRAGALETKTADIDVVAGVTQVKGKKVLTVAGGDVLDTGLRCVAAPATADAYCNKSYVDGGVGAVSARVTTLEALPNLEPRLTAAEGNIATLQNVQGNYIRTDEVKEQELTSALKASDFSSPNVASYDTVISTLDSNYARTVTPSEGDVNLGPPLLKIMQNPQTKIISRATTGVGDTIYWDDWCTIVIINFDAGKPALCYQLKTSIDYTSRSYELLQGDAGTQSRCWSTAAPGIFNHYFYRSRSDTGASPGDEALISVPGRIVRFSHSLVKGAAVRLYSGTYHTLPDSRIVLQMTVTYGV